PERGIAREKVQVRLLRDALAVPDRVRQKARVLREGCVDGPVDAVVDFADVPVAAERAQKRGDLFRGAGSEGPSEHGGPATITPGRPFDLLHARHAQAALGNDRARGFGARGRYVRPLRRWLRPGEGLRG